MTPISSSVSPFVLDEPVSSSFPTPTRRTPPPEIRELSRIVSHESVSNGAAAPPPPGLDRGGDDPMVSAIEERLYRDHSQITPDEVGEGRGDTAVPSGGAHAATFPVKLHCILSDSDAVSVIAWLPHGRAWRVLDPDRLEAELLRRYFGHGRLASFMRQVNGWGFRRITRGVDRDAYYHELFLRGMPHLCHLMTRSGGARRRRGHPRSIYSHLTGVTPDLYRISEQYPLPEVGRSGGDGSGAASAPPSPDSPISSASEDGDGGGGETDAVHASSAGEGATAVVASATPRSAAPVPDGGTGNSALAARALCRYILQNAATTSGAPREPNDVTSGANGTLVFMQRMQERADLVSSLRSILGGYESNAYGALNR